MERAFRQVNLIPPMWLSYISRKEPNKPLKYVPATKIVASTGLANARRLAERYLQMEIRNKCSKK